MNLFRLIKQFRLATGRSPSPNELAKLKQQSELMSRDNVIKFPEGGIDSIPVDKQFGGKKSLDEFTRSENIYEQSMKPKGEGTLKFEKELNVNLYGDETFEELMQIKDTGKHPRDKAAGGRIGFAAGGAKGLLKLLQGKLGKKTLKMADDVDRPKSALDREMFDAANKRFNQKVNERTSAAEVGIDDLFDKDGVLNKDAVLSDITKSVEKTKKSKIVKTKTPDKALLKAMDEIGGGTGDLKYDADVLADELAFQRGLIPEGGDITDIADQMKRMDLYDEAYSALSQQFLKNREIKKMQQFYDERRSTSVFTDEYQKNLDKEVMKEFDFSKKQFDKLSEEAKENFRRQYDGNYADAMEDTAEIVIKDPRPTKTLKSIEDTGTIDISDPNIADEFDTFLRENDPEGYKNLEQKIQLDTFDTKGRKKNAVGGLAYMLGEEPRSEYSGGGGAGAPPVTYGPPVQNQTQIAGNPRHEQLIREAQELEFLKRKAQGNFREEPGNMNQPIRDGLQATYDRPQGTFQGNTLSDLGQAIGDVASPQPGIGYLNTGKDYEASIQAYPNKIEMGFRKEFAGGGLSRRAFLKLLGAGTATAAAAKTGILGLLKGKKAVAAAEVVIPTITKTAGMPDWFPGLVKRALTEGTDVSKVAKTVDGEIVKRVNIKGTDVDVRHRLDTGEVGVKVHGGHQPITPGDDVKIGDLTTAYDEGLDMTYLPGKSPKNKLDKPKFKMEEAEARWEGNPYEPDISTVDVDTELAYSKADLKSLELFSKNKTPTFKDNVKINKKIEKNKGYIDSPADSPELKDMPEWEKMDMLGVKDRGQFQNGGLARLLGE